MRLHTRLLGTGRLPARMDGRRTQRCRNARTVLPGRIDTETSIRKLKPTTTMQHTILSVIQAELTRRLTHYRDQVAAGHMDRETANFRYLCLQTAAWVAGGEKPKTVTSEEETREEIQRWMREIQRDSTVATMH